MQIRLILLNNLQDIVFSVTFHTFKMSKITMHDHNVVVLNIQDGIKIRKIPLHT